MKKEERVVDGPGRPGEASAESSEEDQEPRRPGVGREEEEEGKEELVQVDLLPRQELRHLFPSVSRRRCGKV
jgi:hypothetical protein